MYHELGGVPRGSRASRALAWDMNVDGVAVEVDEAQHFNRYRGAHVGVAGVRGGAGGPP